jgi:hypothetical protein
MAVYALNGAPEYEREAAVSTGSILVEEGPELWQCSAQFLPPTNEIL